MARARNIKPSFFKNEDLVELPFEARLLFIGLWTLADREGRLEDRPKRIKMEVFPADDVDVDKQLSKLCASGFITRYESGNNQFIQIDAFAKHQTPHIKEQASTIPAPGEHQPTQCAAPPDSLNPSLLNPESIVLADKPPAAKRRTQVPDDFYPDEAGLDKATASSVPIADELERFKDFHRGKGNTMLDWQAAWRTWVSNAVKFSKGKTNGYVSGKDVGRKRAIVGLTGYDADAIESVSQRVN